MSLSRTETERIARAINALRPDWYINSLETLIWQHLKPHAYADVAVALTVVATDPRTATPKRVLESGPWWKACQTLGGAATATTPGHPQCQVHKGCLEHEDHPVGADRCPDCRVDLVDDQAAAHARAELVRAEIRKTRSSHPGERAEVLAAAPGPTRHANRLDQIRESLDHEEARP